MKPEIKTPIPGPNSRKIMAELAEYESPAITARHPISPKTTTIPKLPY